MADSSYKTADVSHAVSASPSPLIGGQRRRRGGLRNVIHESDTDTTLNNTAASQSTNSQSSGAQSLGSQSAPQSNTSVRGLRNQFFMLDYVN